MSIWNWHLKCYEIVCSDNEYIIGLVQDCRNSIANTEVTAGYTKPSICNSIDLFSSLKSFQVKIQLGKPRTKCLIYLPYQISSLLMERTWRTLPVTSLF